MTRSVLALALLLVAGSAGAEQRVTIERATIPWSELERLLRSEGQHPPAPGKATPAPRHYALTQADVGGELEGGRANLRVRLEVQVLDEHWVLVPLLPAGLAIASAHVEAPPGHRGLLVREPGGVVFAAEGAGTYALEVSASGALERGREGQRLRLELPGLTGGKAALRVAGGPIRGRTAWAVTEGGPGVLQAEAALGAEGLDLLLPPEAEGGEASASVDGLVAVTVVSLGGSGVTRLTFRATPGPGGGLELELPRGARPWKAYVNGRALDAAGLAEGGRLRLPLKGSSEVEVAYTFELAPLGIRGRYRVELPRVPVPVREASWQLWMPEGLSYGETQAALQLGPACEEAVPAARTPLRGQGKCLGFRRAVLEPGAAYAEGSYAQGL